tara:strand:- start:3174 stop:4334 length:1161 start_codon:yes stop_codon:yes gene_type:complete
MKHNEQLARISKSLIFKEPFYGLFLVGLKKKFTKGVPTAGVAKHNIGIQLYINPTFFEGLSEAHQLGLLKHELLHVSFGHMTLRDLYPDHKLFNIAADLEINQYIDKENLPEGGMVLSMFPELHLPHRAGTKVYYDLLSESHKNKTCPALEEMMACNGEGEEDIHATWEEFDSLDEAEKKLIQKQVEHQLKETADVITKKQGNIPGELAEIISRLLNPEPPKFNWKAYLRRFVGSSSIVYTKKLRRKDNKRYSANPGLKIKVKNHILVGVDTSGSVSTDELIEFMHELSHMSKTGHKITVAQCDTQLVSVAEFDPKKDWDIKGRGGTSFQPVVDHYNEKGKQYTALIYLTDGEAYPPEDCPKNTLWVHSSQSSINDNLPGLKIKLN